MEFDFVNKIWLPQLGRGRGRKIFLFALGGIILLLNIFQALMDGFGKVNWFVGFVVPALLISIGLMGTRRGGYITSSCQLKIEKDSVCVTYPAIDRQDKKGVHSEFYTISKREIREIQFSEHLQSLRIIYQSALHSFLLNAQKQFGHATEGENKELVLYPQDEQIDNIIIAFETILGFHVRYMDNG